MIKCTKTYYIDDFTTIHKGTDPFPIMWNGSNVKSSEVLEVPENTKFSWCGWSCLEVLEPVEMEVYRSPYDEKPTKETFACVDAYHERFYDEDFSLFTCGDCGRDIWGQCPSNGWIVQYTSIKGADVGESDESLKICSKCIEITFKRGTNSPLLFGAYDEGDYSPVSIRLPKKLKRPYYADFESGLYYPYSTINYPSGICWMSDKELEECGYVEEETFFIRSWDKALEVNNLCLNLIKCKKCVYLQTNSAAYGFLQATITVWSKDIEK